MSKHDRLRATQLQQVFRDQGRQLQWLAAKAGLSEPFTSRVIRGQRTISTEHARLIADALDAPLFLLFESAYADNSATQEVAA